MDVNVLLALLNRGEEQTDAAVLWLGGQKTSRALLTCRITQMGAIRLSTMPSVMGADVVSGPQAWTDWDELMSDYRFAFVNEPTALEASWRKLTDELPKGSSTGTDTYLAAMAIAGDWTLVTFDSGFRKFKELKLELLS